MGLSTRCFDCGMGVPRAGMTKTLYFYENDEGTEDCMCVMICPECAKKIVLPKKTVQDAVREFLQRTKKKPYQCRS